MFQSDKKRKGSRGQSITEYLLLVVGVLTVVILAVMPGGFFTKGVDKSLNLMLSGVDKIATEPCLGTIDRVDGQWSGWGGWGPCTSCTQIRTRTCTAPAPKCGGSACILADGSKGLQETEHQACDSGTWVVGSCGTCTGNCGSTAGTCTQAVTCDGGCCDSATQPASVMACTKPAYPDVWSGLGFGSCSTSCGPGISSQTVTCSGMCCDAMIKPPTREACTDGCCAQTLDIGLDIENSVQFQGTFGPAGPGPFSVSCPPGYAGSPTSTCTATASGSCTGNDTYSPPASCYTIGWGPVSNTCVPADCLGTSVNAGYGRTWDVPPTLHGNTATLTCSADGWHYTGTASYECWLGAWRNLNAGCIPNCPREDNVFIGADLYVTFPVTVSGASVNLTCSSYDVGPNPGDKKYAGSVSRSCSIGTWSGITGTCDYKPCSTEYFMDPNGFVQGTFSASPHSTTPVTQDCSTIDNRYTGSFARTCTYGDWLNPTGGCAAASCPAWTTPILSTADSVYVNVTFAGSGHGVTVSGTETDPTHTCNVQAKCCFGRWVDPATDCSSVTTSTTNSYSTTCSCWLNQCLPSTDPGLSATTATRCSASGDPTDETGLSADTGWSVVDFGGCTATKCQYQCNSGYIKSGNTCVAAPQCTGSAPFAGVQCGVQPPSVDTARYLSQTCATNLACEYHCDTSANYVYYSGSCCYNVCPTGSCGTRTVCGQSKWCGSCCGNGAIDSGEVCDTTGPMLNGKTCADFGYTGNCGSLGCSSGCGSFDTTNCKNKVDGAWGGSWVNVGGCGTYQTCKQRQQQQTCVGASCGGACPGAFPEQYVTCGPCCGNGIIDGTEQCEGSNLNGKTCVTQGYNTGTLACNAGCAFDTSGCRYWQCTGGVPDANSTMCSGDNTGLSADTANVLSSSCSAPKCQYTCKAGYTYAEGTWTYYASGTYPCPHKYLSCPLYPGGQLCSSAGSFCENNPGWCSYSCSCDVYRCQ